MIIKITFQIVEIRCKFQDCILLVYKLQWLDRKKDIVATLIEFRFDFVWNSKNYGQLGDL